MKLKVSKEEIQRAMEAFKVFPEAKAYVLEVDLFDPKDVEEAE